MLHPADEIATAKTYREALAKYQTGLEFERDALWIRSSAEREAFLADPEVGHDPDVYEEELARCLRALTIYESEPSNQLDAMLDRMRAEGLEAFADALETGDFAGFLVI